MFNVRIKIISLIRLHVHVSGNMDVNYQYTC